MGRTRAERRAFAERAKRAARRQVARRRLQDLANAPRVIGMHATTRCTCSGPCCGNPRRHFGEATIQERRALATLDAE